MTQLIICIIIFAASLVLYAVNVIPMVQETSGYSSKALINRGAVISLVLAAVQVFYVMTVFPAF